MRLSLFVNAEKEKVSGKAKAERLIAEALRTGGVSEDQIASWRKGHPFWLKLAATLCAETTVTVSWIARDWRWEPEVTWRTCSISAPEPCLSQRSPTTPAWVYDIIID